MPTPLYRESYFQSSLILQVSPKLSTFSHLYSHLIFVTAINTGIAADKQVVLGETRDEIIGFEDLAVKYAVDHPNHYILMIIDENLNV